jgi:hypothetical protein
MAVNQGKRPSSRVQGSTQHSAISNQPKPTKRSGHKAAGRRELKRQPKWPVCVVTRLGKTTIRQFQGRRFVRFGDFRGKKVAWVEFYTWGTEYNSISVRFQDRTVVSFRIDPMFAIKPQYYRLRDGDLETVKEWPQMRMEK